MAERRSEKTRKTGETDIALSLHLDGAGVAAVDTGVGFFDHMLTLLARHGLFDLTVKASGDTQVDAHHTVEDVGIVLGQAVAEAVGDKKGIARYGSFLLPMDEALARVALDLSGRAHLEYHVELAAETVGEFDTCLGREFFRAFSANAGLTLHVDLLRGVDPHHGLEAVFKGVGRALRAAVSPDARETGVPSSKGVL